MAITQKELDRREQLRAYAKNKGMRLAPKIVGNVEIINRERLDSLSDDDIYLISSNHVSQGDYFLAPFLFMINDKPFLRTVAGKNLNHPIIKRLVWDFEKWGALWHDRSKKASKVLMEYGRTVQEALQEGESVLVFPEGRRNRHPETGPEDFSKSFYRFVVRAQEEIREKPIKLVTMASVYDRRMEDGFFEKIDNSRGIGYFAWDVWAHARWRYFTPLAAKGKITVNFSEPRNLSDVQGEGDEKTKATRISDYTIQNMEKLLGEIRESRLTSRDLQEQRMPRGLVTG